MSRRTWVILAVAFVAAVVALLLVGTWLLAAFTGRSTTTALSAGDSLPVQGTNVAMRVPAGFSGEAVAFVPPPAWVPSAGSPVSEGIRHNIAIQQSDPWIQVSASSFWDDSAYEAQRRKLESLAGMKALTLTSTPFETGGWSGLSREATTSATVVVYGRDPSTGQGVILNVTQMNRRAGSLPSASEGVPAPPLPIEVLGSVIDWR